MWALLEDLKGGCFAEVRVALRVRRGSTSLCFDGGNQNKEIDKEMAKNKSGHPMCESYNRRAEQ